MMIAAKRGLTRGAHPVVLVSVVFLDSTVGIVGTKVHVRRLRPKERVPSASVKCAFSLLRPPWFCLSQAISHSERATCILKRPSCALKRPFAMPLKPVMG